jgi:hypothetical protein
MRFDNNLNQDERQNDQDILLNLRQLIVEGNLLEKANLIDQLGSVANVTHVDADRTTHISFDGSALTNLLGANIDLILGQHISGNVSIGIK